MINGGLVSPSVCGSDDIGRRGIPDQGRTRGQVREHAFQVADAVRLAHHPGMDAQGQQAAVAGAVSGSAVSIGIALAIEGVKQWLGRGGAGQ